MGPSLETRRRADLAWSLGYPDGEQVPPSEFIAAIARNDTLLPVPTGSSCQSGFALLRRVAREAFKDGTWNLMSQDMLGGGPLDALFASPLGI